MKTWNERLVYAMNERGASSADLVRRVGVKSSSVSAWVTGKTQAMGGKNTTIVCNFLNITSTWLYTGRLPSGLPSLDKKTELNQPSQPYSSNQAQTDIVISHYDLAQSTTGLKQITVTETWIKTNLKNHTGIKNLALANGIDNSMKGAFNNGDLLIIDTGINNYKVNSPYIFRVDGETYIRHLQKVPGVGLMAISENKAFQPFTITSDMDFEVYGRIIRALNSVDF